MIKTEREYRRSLAIVRSGEKAIAVRRQELMKANVPADRIKRELAPTQSFLQDIKDDIRWYTSLKH